MEGKDVFSIVATTISVAAAVLSAAAMILRATNKKPENEPQPNTYCYANTCNGYYNNYTHRNYCSQPQPQYVAPQPVPVPAPTPALVPTPATFVSTQQTEELKWNDCTSNNATQNNVQTTNQNTNPWAGMNMNNGNVWPTNSYGYYTDITMPNTTTPMVYYNNGQAFNYNNSNYTNHGCGYVYPNMHQGSYPYCGYGYGWYDYPNNYYQSWQMQPNNGLSNHCTPYVETFTVPGYNNQTWVGKSDVDISRVFDNYQQTETKPNENCGEWRCENKPNLMPLDDEPNDEIVPMFDMSPIKQKMCNNIAI